MFMLFIPSSILLHSNLYFWLSLPLINLASPRPITNFVWSFSPPLLAPCLVTDTPSAPGYRCLLLLVCCPHCSVSCSRLCSVRYPGIKLGSKSTTIMSSCELPRPSQLPSPPLISSSLSYIPPATPPSWPVTPGPLPPSWPPPPR